MHSSSYPNQNNNSDKRILLAQYGVIAALFVSIVLTLSSSINMEDALYCVVAYIGFFLVNFLGFSVLKKDNVALLLYAIFSAFIWSSYVLKFAAILYLPELLVGVGIGSTINVQALGEKIVPIFLVLCPALAIFFIGLWFGPASKVNLKDKHVKLPDKVNYTFLFIVVIGSILLKFIGQIFFDVGSPIKEGHGLPSLILALYEFIVQDATIVVLNILFFTLLYLRIKRGIFIVSVALVLNVGLSLSAGWKGEMVFQALILAYFFFEIRERVPQKTRRKLFILTTLFLSFMVIIYPYVNTFRNASSTGLDIQEAINKAQQPKKQRSNKEEKGIIKLLERIDGIGTYISAVNIAKKRNRNFPITSLLSNEFSEMIKYEIYGPGASEVMVAFGTTQFAAIYIVGGVVGLYIGAFSLGLFFRISTSFIANHIVKFATTFHAYLPLLCFAWISVLFSGGSISLKLKELFVVIVSIMVIERLVFLKGTSPKFDKYEDPKVPVEKTNINDNIKQW